MSNPESQRYPTLTDAGMRMLRRLREHPAAPIYRNQSGNKLTPEDLAALADYERRVLDARIGWPQEARPDWLDAFVEHTWRDVPHWHRQGERPAEFTAIPTSSRADLAADITAFVPDPLPLALHLLGFADRRPAADLFAVDQHPPLPGRGVERPQVEALTIGGARFQHRQQLAVGRELHAARHRSRQRGRGEQPLQRQFLRLDARRDGKARSGGRGGDKQQSGNQATHERPFGE